MMNRREFGALSAAAVAVPGFAHAAPASSWEQDAVWVKANVHDGYRFTVRTSLPTSIDWPKTRSATFQMHTRMGDVRRSDLERTTFYGSPFKTKADGFFGLSACFDTLDPDDAQCAVNVIDGDSKSRRRTSLWLLMWGERTIHMVTPDGLRPGAGSHSTAAVVIKDWRYAVRVPNLDIADIINKRWYGRQLIERAAYRLPTFKKNNMPKTFLYTSEKMAKAFRLNRIDTFGIPMRGIAALRDDEAVVA